MHVYTCMYVCMQCVVESTHGCVRSTVSHRLAVTSAIDLSVLFYMYERTSQLSFQHGIHTLSKSTGQHSRVSTSKHLVIG